MRSLLIVMAGACASVGTSLAVWAAIALEPTVYCEIATGGLVRTNLDPNQVNVAVSEVLEETRPASVDPEERLINSQYSEQATAWFAESSPLGGAAEERASRLVREQNDIGGGRTRIEILHGEEMPSLVFIEHGDDWRQHALAEMLVDRLKTRGATHQ
ncbi:hypothetical protein MalM25_37920 [Planctomycetes bacterium MalM25]|nr:hypothetical protein MalM25_37920 [Planctomycetes bacterium MalM25]